jgi:hypothetical protein
MRTRIGIAVGIVLGLIVATLVRAAPQAAPPKVSEKLLRGRVAAARQTFESVWRNNKEGLVPYAEVAYRWSKRWLRAELELSAQKADQVAAYQGHKDRMRELTRITRERFRSRVNTTEEASAVDFYGTEAEIWLEQARNK